MDAVCQSNSPKRPAVKKRKKNIRNKQLDETCKHMTAKIDCIASARCCSCCGSLLNSPVEIQSSSGSERESFSGKTKFCKKTNRGEAVCGRKPSWESCEGIRKSEEKLGYSENEISCFIEVIEQKLRESLDRVGGEPLVCRSSEVAGEIPGVIRIRCGSSLKYNVHEAPLTDDVCTASLTSLDGEEAQGTLKSLNVNQEKVGLSKELEQGPMRDICGSQKPSCIFWKDNKCEKYPCTDEIEEDFESISTRSAFKICDADISEEAVKWGELDTVDRLLTSYEQTISLERSRLVYETKDKFDVLDRFSSFDKKCFATVCRQLFRWSYRLSKMWRILASQPHTVVHLPSIGYPSEIRRRASKSFDFLQNLQVTRLGWLANENARVLYVFPSNQRQEMITLFWNLIKTVRPDITENRLSIIQLDGFECLKTRSLNGSRALFQSSKAYRRVKMLTAGRRVFVVPGVIEEIDVLIASELRAPIMGPPLEFQNHFLDKSNVANFLKNIGVDQPPFVPHVRDISELCEGLAHLMIEHPNHLTWLIKINYGINGLQTALISFEKSSSREIIAVKCKKAEKELAVLLMEILPGELMLNKQAYKSYTEFFSDLKKYGGLVQACPYLDYTVLSLGVFVEHDTSTPEVCASADVFHVRHDLTTDLCYGIPQATTARLPLENLVVNVGIAMRRSQYIGYFGIDVLVLRDEERSMDKFLVVDIDPHYTDVIAFTDWVRFCLGVGPSCQCCKSMVSHGQKDADRSRMDAKKRRLYTRKIHKPEDTMERYAICSGKLYSNGLAKYCGTTLVSLCEERNVRYNFKMKQGSMICPIDSERRALGLISLHPKRSRAIDEFAKGLRVLHELSLEKHNVKIKTNMLVSYRALLDCPAENWFLVCHLE